MKRAATRENQSALARLSLDQVWLFAAVAFIALRALLTPIPPHDFWWHMATGRLIVEQGQIPTTDSFSYTRAGEPFYNQSWLAQVWLYGLQRLGGVPLIIVVQALVLALAYGLLLRLCVRRSGAVRLSAGFLLVATLPASFDNWIVRPQTYALPLFVATLYVLTAWRLPAIRASGDAPARFYRPLLLLPVLGILWVNLHGSFVLGGALIALVFVAEALRRMATARAEARAVARRPVGRAEDVLTRAARPARPPLWHLAVAGALTGLSWLVNPGGLQVLGYVRNLLGSSQVTRLVTEWAPPTIRDPGGTIFFLFLIAGIAILAYAQHPPDLVDLLVAGAFLWLALGAVRNNIWFTAVATPLLVVQLATWRPAAATARRGYQGVPGLNAALVGVIALMLLLALPWVKPVLGLPPQLGNLVDPDTPVAAVEALRADGERPARLFHAMSYGSYLIWAAPEQPVWADPRIELYPLEQWLDYQALSSGREVAELLARYGVDGLLLSNGEQEPLVAWARARPTAWELRYADEATSYFVRRQP
ncbi:MAG: hypothetical protein HXY37_14020 [Chloroflexi bacterium]|nr:hypothetical protein [Chloroflexota bacterium]